MTPRPTLGARARRFVLELPLESPDGFGGVVRSYAAGPQLWGAIEMLQGEERVRADRPEQAVTHRVTVRYREGVTPAMRLTCGLRRFRIKARPIRTGGGATSSAWSRRSRHDEPHDKPDPGPARRHSGACPSDAALAALMGGTVRLYDEPPRAAEPVYAVFGDAAARDWSTGSDAGHAHEAAIVVWAGKAAPARRSTPPRGSPRCCTTRR